MKFDKKREKSYVKSKYRDLNVEAAVALKEIKSVVCLYYEQRNGGNSRNIFCSGISIVF